MSLAGALYWSPLTGHVDIHLLKDRGQSMVCPYTGLYVHSLGQRGVLFHKGVSFKWAWLT
jgi:hypothetical protein